MYVPLFPMFYVSSLSGISCINAHNLWLYVYNLVYEVFFHRQVPSTLM